MLTFIIVIHLMIVLAMCGLVLLQKSEGGGLGIGGGGGGGFMSSRGTTNVLSRSTAILAACFFATSLLLSVIAGWNLVPESAGSDDPGRPGAKSAGRQSARTTQRGASALRAAGSTVKIGMLQRAGRPALRLLGLSCVLRMPSSGSA
jgi:preprotein translocase subunit SecG